MIYSEKNINKCSYLCQPRLVSGKSREIIKLRAGQRASDRRQAKEGYGVKEYQKAILLVSPRLEKLIGEIGQCVEARARSSYNGRESAEGCIKGILRLLYAKDAFLVLREKVKEVYAQLTREELYMLEYKYFRRKKKLEGEFADLRCNYCERTYYRRQRKLGVRLNSLFLRAGMTEEWFAKTFSDVPYMMRLWEKVRRTGENSVLDKRSRTELRVSDAPQAKRAQAAGIR